MDVNIIDRIKVLSAALRSLVRQLKMATVTVRGRENRRQAACRGKVWRRGSESNTLRSSYEALAVVVIISAITTILTTLVARCSAYVSFQTFMVLADSSGPVRSWHQFQIQAVAQLTLGHETLNDRASHPSAAGLATADQIA